MRWRATAIRASPRAWTTTSASPSGRTSSPGHSRTVPPARPRKPSTARCESRRSTPASQLRSEPGGRRRSMAEAQARVLVVDDDPVNRLLLARSLEREGHQHSAADNGRRALKLLRAEPFDAVLLDVLMPELDGYEVLAEIVGDPTLRHIPVIMISALEELDSVVRCIEMGAEDYLPKPFNPVLLRARLSGCLTKKRLYDLERQHVRNLFSRFVPE